VDAGDITVVPSLSAASSDRHIRPTRSCGCETSLAQGTSLPMDS